MPKLLAELRVPRLGPGRPRTTPDALATRYDKNAPVYRGGVVLAAIPLWLS